LIECLPSRPDEEDESNYYLGGNEKVCKW